MIGRIIDRLIGEFVLWLLNLFPSRKKYISKKAKTVSDEINHWLGDEEYEFISLGENCNSSWYLKETGNKKASYPFDWIFSSPEIVAHSITDDFQKFLDRQFIYQIKPNQAGHSLYHSSMFNHRNPLRSDEDFSYYERSIARFKNVVSNGKPAVFVITVIHEPRKRPNWRDGFDRSFKVPRNQSIKTFQPMMDQFLNLNPNSKFLFIGQRTQGWPSLKVCEAKEHVFWLEYRAVGQNDGVRYLHPFDDGMVKVLYEGLKLEG